MKSSKLIPNVMLAILYPMILIGCTGQEITQPALSTTAAHTEIMATATSTQPPTGTPAPIATFYPTLTPTKVLSGNKT